MLLGVGVDSSGMGFKRPWGDGISSGLQVFGRVYGFRLTDLGTTCFVVVPFLAQTLKHGS